jgi:hypothetical protein
MVKEYRVLKQTILAVIAVVGWSCATTGATFRSGVGDALLEHPPYYAGATATTVSTTPGRIGHLPIVFQRGASQRAIFDPRSDDSSPVAQLLSEMNAYLDSLHTSGEGNLRIAERGALSGSSLVPPDVQFGCITEGNLTGEDCAERGDSALGRNQRMRLAVGRPSQSWIDTVRQRMASANVERVLVISLEIGQYLPRQTGLRGDKEVELGTNNIVRLPWLTSLETPVTVLQLTGAVLDRNGSAIRIGAEGIHARRTRLLVSALGAQEMLSDSDVSEVRKLQRTDLPGTPLAWRVALKNLVTQLTGAT